MDVSPDQIRRIVIYVFVLIVSVALHEFGHAMMADLLGDDTPRRQGRVTLNPLAHADPIGTLLLPIVGGFYAAHGGFGGFGWGKPVQWQPARVNRKWKMSTAQILVSIAGPGMNVLLGTLIAVVQAILDAKHVIPINGQVDQILGFASMTNFVLFFFNLIPAPPLDGGHVAEHLLPYKYRATFESYAKYGPFVVMAVALIPQIAQIFLIPAQFCSEHVYKLVTHLF
ncbi:MAG TPA: site-2 protease family protein [Kofleriaceae bacterium]|nr:site-2 protease family protein [Kofleriaceae bacterium]